MKKKIGIITLHLGFGGVEQASIALANMLCEEYDVTIINMYKSEIAFNLNKKVKVVDLTPLTSNKKEIKEALKNKQFIKFIGEGLKGVKILYFRTSLMKKYLKNNKYDILISSRFLYTNLISKMKLDSVKIAIEHRHHNNDQKYINNLRKSCNNIDHLVLVSKELTDFYKKDFNTNCIHIPNSIEQYPSKINDKKKKQIISVGRFSPEKGFDDLLDVFKIINDKHKDWKLVIAGDGVEMEKILKKTAALKIKDKVELPGFIGIEKLTKYYDESSIYLMTSHEESFGIVVAESQAYGIPSVAFSTATGTLELISKKNGVIIEGRDKKKMAQEVIKLIENKKELESKSKESYKDAKKYSFDNVKRKWLNFIKSIEK